MDKAENLVIVYNLGDFKTGKIKQTESKQACEMLQKIGFTLISVSYVNASKWLKGLIK